MGTLVDLARTVQIRGKQSATAIPATTATPSESSTDALLDAASESRRQRVLDMLSKNPTARYAILTDTESDPEAVLLTLAIRGRATCELLIPKAKYDPFLLLDLLDRHGGTVH